ncbi:hypothetical protein PQX77_002355 [Marasmius sp. AFHP31]|nr:hypothetical protein PQX77_002355 [Marasmius sp. AFHP31]
MSFVRSTSSNTRASTLRPPRSSRSPYQEGAGKLAATGKAQTPERASVPPALLQKTGRGVRTKSDGVVQSALEDKRPGKEGIEGEPISPAEERPNKEIGHLTPAEAVQKVQQLIDDWDPEKQPECSTFHIKTEDVEKLFEYLEATRARLHIEEVEGDPRISEVTITLASINHDISWGGLESMLFHSVDKHFQDEDFSPFPSPSAALFVKCGGGRVMFIKGAKKGWMVPDGQLRPKARHLDLPGSMVWEHALTQSLRRAILKINEWMKYPAVLSAFLLDMTGTGDDRVATLAFYRKPFKARWAGQVKAAEPAESEEPEELDIFDKQERDRKATYMAEYQQLGLGDDVILPIWKFQWKKDPPEARVKDFLRKWDVTIHDCFICPEELDWIRLQMGSPGTMIKPEMPSQVEQKLDIDPLLPMTADMFLQFSEVVFMKEEWATDDNEEAERKRRGDQIVEARNEGIKKRRVLTKESRKRALGAMARLPDLPPP